MTPEKLNSPDKVRALIAAGSFVLAMPKLCCLIPLLIASGPALAKLLAAVGILGLAAELDQLCSAASTGFLAELPVLFVLALVLFGTTATVRLVISSKSVSRKPARTVPVLLHGE